MTILKSKNPPLQGSSSEPDLLGSGTAGASSYQYGSDLQRLIPPMSLPPAQSTPFRANADEKNNRQNHEESSFGEASKTGPLADGSDDYFYDQAKHDLLERAHSFALPNDPDRGYRGTSLQFCSFRRPHMRAFHASWLCQFACAVCQFSQAPLLAEIQQSLNLTKADIWWTNLWMMLGGVPVRFALGALCDARGARATMALVVAGSAIPSALTGPLATTLPRLTVLRTLLGAMDAFVPGQYWITCQFVREVAGTAMAITGGLGASGSAVTQLLVGSLVFPAVLRLTGGDTDAAWRWSLTVPAGLALLVAWFFYKFSDDCPLGQITEVKRAGLMIQRSAAASFRSGVYNVNSWILFLQFAGSCGVDFTMCNGAASYFHYRFDQSIAAAGAFAFLYGVSAVFARGLGGWISDQAAERYSLRGRLYAQLVCMTIQGLSNVWFARTHSLGRSLYIMVFFSIFVQMSMGTCFGMVSYVDGPNTGSVAGIVGAGGNVGAAMLAVLFMTVDYKDAMEYMGWCTVGAALLTPLIVVKGYRGIFLGEDAAPDSALRRQQSPLMVPGKLHHSPHLVSLRARQQRGRR